MTRKIFSQVLIFIIGLFFILSAVAKLFPVISFEFSLGSYGIPWAWTPYFARTVISIELILGIFLILQYRLKKLSIPLTYLFLVFMTLVLVYRWMTAGADADCGCMGEWLKMTPLQSILKNILIVLLLFFAQKSFNITSTNTVKNYLLAILGIIAFTAPYIIEPVYVGVNTSFDTQDAHPLDTNLFYTENQIDTPKIELLKGKHIIAFLSIKCPHCQKAANKLGIIHRQHPEYPIHLFINGKKETVNEFRKKYDCESIPYSILLQPQFLQLSGPNLPSIQYVKDGIIQRNVDYLDMDNTGIEAFLN